MTSYRADKQAIDTHTHTDTGNDNTRMPKLASGKKTFTKMDDLISAWISNHMPSVLWDEITYTFTNFNGCTVDVSEWMSNFNPPLKMDLITYACWD